MSDLDTSRIRRHCQALGCCAREKNKTRQVAVVIKAKIVCSVTVVNLIPPQLYQSVNNGNNFAQAVSLLTFNLYVSSSGTGRVIKNDYSFIIIFICFSRLTTNQSQKLSHIIVLQHSFRHINWSKLLTQSLMYVRHSSAQITSDKIKSFIVYGVQIFKRSWL